MLKDIAVDDGMPTWKKNFAKKKTDAERKNERKNSLETAFEACGIDDKVTVKINGGIYGSYRENCKKQIKRTRWIFGLMKVKSVRNKRENVGGKITL